MMNFLIFSKLLKIVIQNITFLKIFSISFVKDDWFYYFKKVHKIKISFIHPHAAVDWTFSLDFFSLNLLNIIVLKENRNVFVLEKLSPLPLSPQVSVWSGAEIITLLQTSSFWWIWNQISSVSTLNMLLLSIKLLIGVEIKMLVFSDNVPLVTACSCWEQKKFFWLKILLNFWMVVSILQCFNQNVFYWNQGKIQLFFSVFDFSFLISIYSNFCFTKVVWDTSRALTTEL